MSTIKYFYLPFVFLVSVVGYFAPFYLNVTPATPMAYLYALLMLVWVVLFSSMWVYSIGFPVWVYIKGKLNKQVVLSCLFVWIVYAIWFGFAANGYLVSV